MVRSITLGFAIWRAKHFRISFVFFFLASAPLYFTRDQEVMHYTEIKKRDFNVSSSSV